MLDICPIYWLHIPTGNAITHHRKIAIPDVTSSILSRCPDRSYPLGMFALYIWWPIH